MNLHQKNHSFRYHSSASHVSLYVGKTHGPGVIVVSVGIIGVLSVRIKILTHLNLVQHFEVQTKTKISSGLDPNRPVKKVPRSQHLGDSRRFPNILNRFRSPALCFRALRLDGNLY